MGNALMLKKLSQLITTQRPQLVRPATARDRLVLEPPYPVIYAIGDVHGAYTDMLDAEHAIYEDAAGIPGDKLILYLGDLVDRGPASAHVLEHVLSQPPKGFARMCLCGNHEEAMLSFLKAPSPQHPWLLMGGEQTLQSYGLNRSTLFKAGNQAKVAEALMAGIPERHRLFLEMLPVMIEGPGVAFVHAGMQPGIPLEQQSDSDLMWIREPFLTVGPGLPVMVVHGHTPHEFPSVGRLRVGIDTLALGGALTVVRWANGRLAVISGSDRTPLRLTGQQRRALLPR
ncbi:metallophosphoesterase [Chthonobacter albigriseus]|uniref:metallophosphoesterase n=1 Tax=Chthonobacter albigriseus TaxID=1683161 RepID=UPI0015EFAE7B|nr:metallophosphoesterase [Chthonobacter albigriseus]